MHDYKNYQLDEKDYKSKKNIGRAMEELEKGLITVVNKYNE
jgi:DNA-directed RNA polymerase subunit K/omega